MPDSRDEGLPGETNEDETPAHTGEPGTTAMLLLHEDENLARPSNSADTQNDTTTNVEAVEQPDQVSKCSACFRKFHEITKPCKTKYNPLSERPSRLSRVKYGLLCPPHSLLGRVTTSFFATVFVWGVCWALTQEDALPGGNFFALIVLVVLCVLGGDLVQKIHLPPLLGMLIVGCLLRNVPKINIGKDINPEWSSVLRSTALVVILTRAGLGLDPVALKKLSFGVLRLAFIPCTVETVAVAVASHLLLGFPWPWGFMLGFVLAAVSPAVVVPSMLGLEAKGYGVEKGIPTLVIAAASLDDVLAISGFGVALGIAFSQGNLVLTIFKGPLEALGGVLYGFVMGVLTWYFPHKDHEQKTLYRFLLLFCGGMLAVLGSRELDISGAGALGCLTMAFVSALRWRKEVQQGSEAPINKIMAELWKLFQPLLFGLIGAEVDISKIEPTTIGLGVAVLVIGLVFRMIASYLAVLRLGLSIKEKLFIPFAWLPKATVQAAIGSTALDTARKKLDPVQISLGQQVLTIAVLVILITAPLGAIAIAMTAPRFLEKAEVRQVKEVRGQEVTTADEVRDQELTRISQGDEIAQV